MVRKMQVGEVTVVTEEKKVIKEWCDACNCLINPVGHAARCGKRDATSAWVKSLAWFGDAWLEMFARRFVMEKYGGRPGDKAAALVCKERLAAFGRICSPEIVSPGLKPVSESDRAMATSVEAAYALSHDYRALLAAWYGCPNADVDSYAVAGIDNLNHASDETVFGPGMTGYEYLNVIRTDEWQKVARSLGACPYVRELRKHVRSFSTGQKWGLKETYAGCGSFYRNHSARGLDTSEVVMRANEYMRVGSANAASEVSFAPGYHYLRLFRPEMRTVVQVSLGRSPTVRAILQVREYLLDQAMITLSKTSELTLSMTFGSQGLNEPLCLQLERFSPLCVVQDVSESVGSSVTASALDRAVGKARSEFLASRVADATACKCQVHLRPITADPYSFADGCCKEPPGLAGVMRNAFAQSDVACVVDEATRKNDERALELVLQYDDKGGGSSIRSEVKSLCTSQFCDMTYFGNGYCYMNLIRPSARWRVARCLGPNPSIGMLLLFARVFGRRDSFYFDIRQVEAGRFHIVVHDGGTYAAPEHLLGALEVAVLQDDDCFVV